ncbi:hypothetical protein K461DRAFT_270604 [Myriangium duriaei CBS 260.36]|uniref:BTB domain-containing protein n=1 Tax=Myriangium duriaei CBS 260.36 TaxID=1168546 RepID=A0A9P4IYJ7_9PEZI|nr:hypothetical protein K461DRAFT_270604 [Myriangium duriaei CBS 260.36]
MKQQNPTAVLDNHQWEQPLPEGGCINPGGDLILELYGGETLLVSSEILSSMSPVFHSIFSGRWAEYAPRDENSRARHCLDDDDPELFKHLLICAHGHWNMLPGIVAQICDGDDSLAELAGLAALGNKYDCLDLVKEMTWKHYLAIIDGNLSLLELGTLAEYAAYMRNAAEFYRLTRRIVLESDTPFCRLQPSDILTPDIIAGLTAQRRRLDIETYFCYFTLRATRGPSGGIAILPDDDAMVDLKSGFNSQPRRPPSWVMSRLYAFAFDPRVAPHNVDPIGNPCTGGTYNCTCYFHILMADLQAAQAGLCLQCARLGRVSAMAIWGCRVMCPRSTSDGWTIQELRTRQPF